MPTKKPSAKQLAARAKFVKMVRAKAAKSKAAKKKTVGKIVKKKTTGMKIAKYKLGEKVYSYQNKDYAAPINKTLFSPWNNNGINDKRDTYKYVLTLKDGNSNFIDEKSISKKSIGAVKKTIKQTGTSNKVYDKRIQAKKPGKRISKKGNKYTENRENRSDKGKLLGIVKPKPTIISLSKKIAKLTDINDHNKAVLTLAKFLKNKNTIAVMNNMIKMHNSYGFMPNSLISLRKDILQNLFTMFKHKFGEIDYKLIYSSF